MWREMIELSFLMVFLKLGAIGFGGGYAILSIMFNSVAPFDIISAEEFQNLIAISQITPGPVAINMATYVGYLSDGWAGAFICSVLLCVPGMVMMYIMIVLLKKGRNLKIVHTVLSKVRIAGIVLLITSGIFIADGTIIDFNSHVVDVLQIFIFTISLAICFKFKPGPIKLLVAMGLVSLIFGCCLEMII